MELEHSFSVPVDIATAWTVLRDVERIAPCMPGATIDSVDGDDFTGRVKVKVGAMQITYKGEASFVEVDDAAHRAVIDARGREARGSGTANAMIRAQLTERTGTDETLVEVHTDLAVTGKPAQFGRGILADVGEKLIGRFADCLAGQLAEGERPAASAAAEAEAAESDSVVAGSATEDQPAGATVAGDLAVGAAPAAAASPATTEGAVTPTDGTLRPPDTGAPTTGELEGARVPASGAAPAAPRQAEPRPRPRAVADDVIDLLDVAGAPVLKRLAPVALIALVLLVVWWVRRD